MQPRLSTPQVKRKPKRFFGLWGTAPLFLSSNFELKTTYAAVVSYYHFYMKLDQDSKAHDSKAAKRIISRCDSSFRKAHSAWRRAKGDKSEQRRVVERILSSVKKMRYQFYLLVSTYNKAMKPANKAKLPSCLLLTYTLDEIRDFSSNLLHRMDSNYLYEGSKEKAQLKKLLVKTLDSVWSQYLNETQQADDSGAASEIIYNIFEYVIILLYKINDGGELTLFSQLASETTQQIINDCRKPNSDYSKK